MSIISVPVDVHAGPEEGVVVVSTVTTPPLAGETAVKDASLRTAHALHFAPSAISIIPALIWDVSGKSRKEKVPSFQFQIRG